MEILVTVRSKSDGAVQEARCPDGGGLTLGRGPDSPIALAGTGISREHLRFEANGDGLTVTDLSSNGTWVNGERLARGEKRGLNARDEVEVPGYVITITAPQAVVAPVRAEAAAVAVPAPPPLPAPAPTPLARVRAFVGSFTRLERFLVLVAVCSLALLAVYLSL